MISFTRTALCDIEEAAKWYEGQQEGLGDRFIEDVNETASRIEANPKGYVKTIDDARKAMLRKFPYAVWFRISSDGEIVIACVHARRNTKLALERVKGVIPFGP